MVKSDINVNVIKEMPKVNGKAVLNVGFYLGEGSLGFLGGFGLVWFWYFEVFFVMFGFWFFGFFFNFTVKPHLFTSYFVYSELAPRVINSECLFHFMWDTGHVFSHICSKIAFAKQIV